MIFYIIGYIFLFFATCALFTQVDNALGVILILFCCFLLIYPWLTISDEQVTKISEIYNKPEYAECKSLLGSTVNNYQALRYFKCIDNIDELIKFREMKDGTFKGQIDQKSSD